MPGGKSDEMDRVDPEDGILRASGERLRGSPPPNVDDPHDAPTVERPLDTTTTERALGPATVERILGPATGEHPLQRPPVEPKREAFDDVTPTRSLAEVGLADMDEDLPTRMQTLDELARLGASTDASAPHPIPLAASATPARRDVLRPPAAPPPSDPPAASPSTPPPGDGVAFRSFPPPKGRTVPPAPALPREASSFVDRPSTPPAPETPREPPPVLFAISFVLLVVAIVALVVDRMVD